MEDFIQRYYLDKDDLYICDDVIQFFKDSKEHHIKGQFSSNSSDVVDLEVKESTDIQKDFQFFLHCRTYKKTFRYSSRKSRTLYKKVQGIMDFKLAYSSRNETPRLQTTKWWV